MTVRQRLVLSIVGISALLVIPAIYSLTQLQALNDIASLQRTRHGEAYLTMGGLQARLAELNRLQRTYVIAADSEVHAEMRAALDSARVRLAELHGAGYGEPSRDVETWVDSLYLATAHIEELTDANREEEASNYFLRAVRPMFINVESAIRRLYAHVDRMSRQELEDAQIISAAAIVTTLAALLICATIAFGLGAWTTRALTSPIMRLRDSMALVEEGEFHVPETLPYDRKDEIGSVSRSFRAMTHRLADLDRLKAELMSISTHELKTPINVISGYAELMQERVYGDLSDKQEEALASIREQTRILAQLVNQLLDVSRIEAGGMRLYFRDVPVRDLLLKVERSFEALATRKNIDFRVNIDPSVPETIPGDFDRLADQVLGNLLSNALKFTPEGGRIEVRSWLLDDNLAVEVEDSGPGIPADQLPYIFDKFYQIGDQARSKGAGLGLAIAHEVVTSHGGSLAAFSEPGQGALFRIVLPTSAASAEQPELAEPLREGAHSR